MTNRIPLVLVNGTESELPNHDGIAIDYAQFDTAETWSAAQGKLGWDGGTTLNLGMTANVVQRIGEDTFFYIKASSAITKGQLCMFTGTVGTSGVLTAGPATGVTNGQYIIGLAAETLALNDFGLIQSFGTLRGLDTTGSSVGQTWHDGDVLFYNSAYTGGLTNVYPTSGPIVTVAAVISASNGGSGSLQIRPSVTQRMSAGTSISVTQNSSGTTINNTAPDQTVVLTAGTGISTSGTYPNFTITNTAPGGGGGSSGFEQTFLLMGA